jgi:hypothetical protein
MKKALIIVMLIFIGFVGFLVYDWHVKTTIQQDDQRVSLYSWTDEKGEKHFTDTQPPDNARNVEELKGFKYVDPPLAIRIQAKAVEMYRWVKEKMFKKKDGKKNKRSSIDGQRETIHATGHAHLQFISSRRCRRLGRLQPALAPAVEHVAADGLYG